MQYTEIFMIRACKKKSWKLYGSFNTFNWIVSLSKQTIQSKSRHCWVQQCIERDFPRNFPRKKSFRPVPVGRILVNRQRTTRRSKCGNLWRARLYRIAISYWFICYKSWYKTHSYKNCKQKKSVAFHDRSFDKCSRELEDFSLPALLTQCFIPYALHTYTHAYTSVIICMKPWEGQILKNYFISGRICNTSDNEYSAWHKTDCYIINLKPMTSWCTPWCNRSEHILFFFVFF